MKRRCLVIGPVGEKDSDTRKRADLVMDEVIKPVVEPQGYSITRIDRETGTVRVPPEIITHLLDDDLVVADLTGQNANVFYELGVRHAAQKPVVHLIEAGELLPFDIRDIRAITVKSEDVRSRQEASTQLARFLSEVGMESLVPLPISRELQARGFSALFDFLNKAAAVRILRGTDVLLDEFKRIRALPGVNSILAVWTDEWGPLTRYFREEIQYFKDVNSRREAHGEEGLEIRRLLNPDVVDQQQYVAYLDLVQNLYAEVPGAREKYLIFTTDVRHVECYMCIYEQGGASGISAIFGLNRTEQPDNGKPLGFSADSNVSPEGKEAVETIYNWLQRLPKTPIRPDHEFIQRKSLLEQQSSVNIWNDLALAYDRYVTETHDEFLEARMETHLQGGTLRR